MNVFLLDPQMLDPRLGDLPCAAYRELCQLASGASNQRFARVVDAEEADLILAPIQFNGFGLFFHKLRQSSFYRRHRSRVYVYCPDDNVFPSVPGVYPSVQARFVERDWARAGSYVSAHIHKFDFPADLLSRKDIDCSFAGSTYTHPVRKRIVALETRGVRVLDASSSPDDPWYSQTVSRVEHMRDQFRDILERSRFTICPRGEAPSSIRLFEAMQASCVPIIVSDDQVLPEGPQWEHCSIRVGENDVSSIPDRVAELRADSMQMGAAARREWDRFFAPESGFHTMCCAIESLHRALQPVRARRECTIALGKYLEPGNFRALCRDWKSRIQSAGQRRPT